MTEGFFSDPPDAAESGPLNKAEAANLLIRAGHDYRDTEDILAATAAPGKTGKPLEIGPHTVLYLATTGRWYIEGPQASPFPDGLRQDQAASRYEARWLGQIRDIAASRRVTDAQAGGRIRALLFPAHIHDDDGTVEGCPGCFPPGEVIGPVWPAAACGYEPEILPWPDLGEGWNVGEILAALRAVDAHLDTATAPAYRDQPLAGHWSRIGKAAAEAQEAIEALGGATGENPRKGVCDTWEHVMEELGDTACAALLGIQHITKDTDVTWAVFIAALAKALGRVPQQRPVPVTTTEGEFSS